METKYIKKKVIFKSFFSFLS